MKEDINLIKLADLVSWLENTRMHLPGKYYGFDASRKNAETNLIMATRRNAEALKQWAGAYWGVQTERVWHCPLSDGGHVYQTEYHSGGGYCPDDGRKLKLITIESQEQAYERNLGDFMRWPDYPEPPSQEWVSDLVSTNAKPTQTHAKSAQSDPKRKANT